MFATGQLPGAINNGRIELLGDGLFSLPIFLRPSLHPEPK
jgi:hypothetical protein